MFSTVTALAACILGQVVGGSTTKPIHVPTEAVESLDFLVGTWQVTAQQGQNEVGEGTWKIAWEEGKPCLRCTQVWRDARGTDVGAGIWGYDVAKRQIVYVQFYVSGANAVIRFDVKSSEALKAAVWKGRMSQVSDTAEPGEAAVELEKKTATEFVFRAIARAVAGAEKQPAVELHFRKIHKQE